MKRIFIALIIVLAAQQLYGQIPRRSLTDLYGDKITADQLKSDSVVFLISSLSCGYCLRDIPYFNKLSQKYSSKIRFVVLLDDKKEYVQQYVSKGNTFYNEFYTVIPNALFYMFRIWKYRVFPEYVVYFNGKRVARFAYSNDETHSKVVEYLDDVTGLH